MSSLKSLVGGGGGGGKASYQSGNFYNTAPIPNSLTAASANVNSDVLVPFVPHEDVTVSHLGFLRANTNAGNVFRGILDASGTLLTDCAVDSNTTAGLHEVSTTATLLSANTLYYDAINESAGVVVWDQLTTTDAEYPDVMRQFDTGFKPAMFTSLPSTQVAYISRCFFKSRTAALFPSSTTMTGFVMISYPPFIGFTAQ